MLYRLGERRMRAPVDVAAPNEQRELWVGAGVGDDERAALRLRERSRQREADPVAVGAARTAMERGRRIALQAGAAVGNIDRRAAGRFADSDRDLSATVPVRVVEEHVEDL